MFVQSETWQRLPVCRGTCDKKRNEGVLARGGGVRERRGGVIGARVYVEVILHHIQFVRVLDPY